jgi:hypothetical protein
VAQCCYKLHGTCLLCGQGQGHGGPVSSFCFAFFLVGFSWWVLPGAFSLCMGMAPALATPILLPGWVANQGLYVGLFTS